MAHAPSRQRMLNHSRILYDYVPSTRKPPPRPPASGKAIMVWLFWSKVYECGFEMPPLWAGKIPQFSLTGVTCEEGNTPPLGRSYAPRHSHTVGPYGGACSSSRVTPVPPQNGQGAASGRRGARGYLAHTPPPPMTAKGA
jgi:hypothetical protein